MSKAFCCRSHTLHCYLVRCLEEAGNHQKVLIDQIFKCLAFQRNKKFNKTEHMLVVVYRKRTLLRHLRTGCGLGGPCMKQSAHTGAEEPREGIVQEEALDVYV